MRTTTSPPNPKERIWDHAIVRDALALVAALLIVVAIVTTATSLYKDITSLVGYKAPTSTAQGAASGAHTTALPSPPQVAPTPVPTRMKTNPGSDDRTARPWRAETSPASGRGPALPARVGGLVGRFAAGWEAALLLLVPFVPYNQVLFAFFGLPEFSSGSTPEAPFSRWSLRAASGR